MEISVGGARCAIRLASSGVALGHVAGDGNGWRKIEVQSLADERAPLCVAPEKSRKTGKTEIMGKRRVQECSSDGVYVAFRASLLAC